MLVGASEFDSIKINAENNNTLKSYVQYFKDNIDSVIYVANSQSGEKDLAPLPDNSITDGTRLDNASAIQSHIIGAALIYKLTDDSAYRDCAINVMMNTASDDEFPDWNPKKHFLDTATIMYGMSVGYNWLYDELTPSQQSAISNAIVKKGLEPALEQHNTPYCNFNWTANKTNWNFVCNSATVMGALAVSHSEANRKLCSDLIAKSLQSMEGAIGKFSVDGAWYESPVYGQYAMGYFMPAMESMRLTLGTDYGYGTQPRINAFNDFVIYTHGARETFNFGDGGEARLDSPTLSLHSKISESNFYGAYRYNQIATTKKAAVEDIIWFKPEFATYNINSHTGDRLFNSIHTATFRNSFVGNISFAGLHGGDNGVTHSHLDSGSFVYDYNGVRFASDLGQNDYNSNGYFTTNPSIQPNRWNYYRTRAESHNTLVINPTNGPDQIINSVSKIDAFKSSSDYGFAVLNTTQAYANDVKSSKRGIYYNKSNCSLLVQDEINLEKESDVYWNMTFAEGAQGASIDLSADGKSAVLTREGHRVWVGIVSGDGKFTNEACSSMFEYPNSTNQANNGWYRKLQIKQTLSGNQTIAVYICPLADGENAPASIPTIISMSQWK